MSDTTHRRKAALHGMESREQLKQAKGICPVLEPPDGRPDMRRQQHDLTWAHASDMESRPERVQVQSRFEQDLCDRIRGSFHRPMKRAHPFCMPQLNARCYASDELIAACWRHRLDWLSTRCYALDELIAVCWRHLLDWRCESRREDPYCSVNVRPRSCEARRASILECGVRSDPPSLTLGAAGALLSITPKSACGVLAFLEGGCAVGRIGPSVLRHLRQALTSTSAVRE